MRSLAFSLAWILATLLAGAAVAQEAEGEEAKKNWSNKTEFGLNSTSGNSETFNLSFGNEYKRFWDRAEFLLEAVAVRNESTQVTKTVDQTVNPPVLIVTESDEVTVETYLLGAKYRRNITDRLMWYVNSSWSRILQAGIDNRYRAGAGIGYAFVKANRHSLIGEIGGDYTDEERAGGDTASFAGARGFLDYDYKFGSGSELSSDLEMLENLDDSDDWRVNWLTSVTSSLSSRVALKVSYAVLYDNQPVVETLFVGPPPLTFEFDKTDTILTASVVVNF